MNCWNDLVFDWLFIMGGEDWMGGENHQFAQLIQVMGSQLKQEDMRIEDRVCFQSSIHFVKSTDIVVAECLHDHY